MKKTLKCQCGKEMKQVRDFEIEKVGLCTFGCDCGKKIVVPKADAQIKIWEKYKVKINQECAGKFEELLKTMNLEYNITPYTKDLIIWGIYIYSEEDIAKVKDLSYVTSFSIMPVFSVS